VTDALRDLPVLVVKEPTSVLWHRNEQILRERPSLVLGASTVSDPLPAVNVSGRNRWAMLMVCVTLP
jgi:hypothetical protein